MLVALAMVGIGLFAGITVLFHLLRPDLDPISRYISEYAVGHYSFLMTIAFLALATGSLALCIALARGIPLAARSRSGLILLALWSLGGFIVSIFPTDLVNEPFTTHGIIHGIAATGAFLSLCFSAVLMSQAFKHDKQWQAASRPGVLAGILLIILLLAFFLSPISLKGITERIFVGACLAWLTWLATKIRILHLK
ncbi:MAG: hypothetical protein NVS4B9_15140 [Ktedonobacteraceae bacterium]